MRRTLKKTAWQGHLGPDIVIWDTHTQHVSHYNTFPSTQTEPQQQRGRKSPTDRVIAGLSGLACLCFVLFVLYKMLSFA